MRPFLMLIPALAVAGCSAGVPSGESQSTSAEALAVTGSTDAPAAAGPSQGAGGAAPVQVTLPKLAYVYKLGFRLPADRVGTVQEAHRAACERMGPARCQLLAMTLGSADDATGVATLKLRVAGPDGRSFSDAATRSVVDAGGRATDTNVAAEDVSKQIVDAEARIHQRELLVARLTEILRTRAGKVSELVEAERNVADAQEELDKAKGWLTELRGRVAMSDFEISYAATAPSASTGSAGKQLGEALAGSGASFLIGLRGLLTVLIYLAPWLLLAIPIALLVRGARRKAANAKTPAGDG